MSSGGLSAAPRRGNSSAHPTRKAMARRPDASARMRPPSHDRRLPLAVPLPDVEGGVPDSDHTVSHPPHLEPASRHALAGVAVLPGALPDIGEHIALEGLERLLQAVVPLSRQARGEELAERIAAPQLRLLGEPDDAVLGEAVHERLDVTPVEHVLDRAEQSGHLLARPGLLALGKCQGLRLQSQSLRWSAPWPLRPC